MNEITSTKINLLESVEECITTALIEEWECFHDKKILTALTCTLDDYKKICDKYNVKGVSHMTLSRELLEIDAINNSFYKREYNKGIKEQCLKAWNEKDGSLYTIIVLEFEE